MPRLILLLLAAFGVWYGWQYIKTRPPQQRKRLLWVWGSSLLIVIAVLLVASGRMHWLGVVLAVLIPLFQTLVRWLPRLGLLAGLLGRRMGPSTITTKGLKVTFDFARGKAWGEVLSGPHGGQPLESLSEDQLKEQLAFFQGSDRQSALLLQAYLVKQGFGGFAGAGGNGQQLAEGTMSAEEARQILGVSADADRETVLKAHKRLIQKLHPDRGGNQYLAAKVNAARDKLVG